MNQSTSSSKPEAPPLATRSLLARAWASSRADVFWCLVAALGSLFTAMAVLHVWTLDLTIPFLNQGDAVAALQLVESMQRHGWYLTNPDLGAPFGQQMYDFPAYNGDVLQFAIMRVMLVGMAPAVVYNVYYLAGYAAVAVSAYIVYRLMGLRGPVAAAVGLVYSLVSYHFIRGEGHFFLAAYFSVPLGGWLAVRVLQDTPVIARRSSVSVVRRWDPRPWASRTTIGTFIACVIVATSGVYYAVFSVLLIGCAIVAGTVTNGSLLPIRRGVVTTLIIGVVLTAAMAPSLVWRISHGSDAAVSTRQVSESETLGLKLASVVLPAPHHRIDFLGDLTERYDEQTGVRGEFAQSIGFLGDVGLLVLMLCGVATLMQAKSTTRFARFARSGNAEGAPVVPLTHVWYLTAAALTIGTVSGGGTLFALLVSPQIRGWNRITVFISFLSLYCLGRIVQAAVAHPRLRGRRWAWAAAFGVVVVIGVLDQTSSIYRVLPQTQNRHAWHSDASFVMDIERHMPARTMVLQEPRQPFPENPPGALRMQDYDALRLYSHSSTLRWSGGAMKGRPTDWREAGARRFLPRQEIVAAAAAGFGAVVVDTYGYADSGVAIEADLKSLTGATPRISGDDRYAWYDIRPVRMQTVQLLGAVPTRDLGFNAVRPIVLNLDADPANLYPGEADARGIWHWMRRTAQIRYEDPWAPRQLKFGAWVYCGDRKPCSFSMRLPDGSVVTRDIPSGGLDLEVEFTSHRSGVLNLATSSGRATPPNWDHRELRAQLIGIALDVSAFRPLPAVLDTQKAPPNIVGREKRPS